MEAFKETLQIRLTEDESGVYPPSERVSFTSMPSQKVNLTVSFGCAPQNVEKLIASALDEIEKIKKDGPSQVNLNKYKAETHRTMGTSFAWTDMLMYTLGILMVWLIERGWRRNYTDLLKDL